MVVSNFVRKEDVRLLDETSKSHSQQQRSKHSKVSAGGANGRAELVVDLTCSDGFNG